MLHTGITGHHKQTALRWKDNKPRPLSEAARLALEMAQGEHLPICETLGGGAQAWFAQSILDTVAVYGTRTDAIERIEPSARQDLQLNAVADTLERGDEIVWRALHVKRVDFDHYLDWLRSVW